jgi:hypothetical protein
MDREDIIRMARGAGFKVDWQHADVAEIKAKRYEYFAALVAAAERNKLAAWMIQRGYATGHGDTIKDLLKELEWQIAEREREACAKVVEDFCGAWNDEGYALAAAIRART